MNVETVTTAVHQRAVPYVIVGLVIMGWLSFASVLFS